MGSSDSASNLEEWINGCGSDPHRNLPACVGLALEQARTDKIPILRIECRTTQFDGGSSHQEWSNTINVETTSETQLIEAIRARLVQAPGETFVGAIQVLIKPPSGAGSGNLGTYQRRMRPYRPEALRLHDAGSVDRVGGESADVTALRQIVEENRANNRMVTDQLARFMSITFDGQAKFLDSTAEVMKASAKILAAHHGPTQNTTGKSPWDLVDKAMMLGAANDSKNKGAQPMPQTPPPASGSSGGGQVTGPAPAMPAGLLSEPRAGAAPAQLEAAPAPLQIAADPPPQAPVGPPALTREHVEAWAQQNPDEAQKMILSALADRNLTVAPL